MSTGTARSISVTITYDSTDISENIKPYIKSLSYRDAMSGKADDFQLTLEDREGLWLDDWMPSLGATLDVSLEAKYWKDADTASETLHLGTFELDEITNSASPSEAQIKAVSVPFDNTLRGEEHTRSWEKAELKTIITDIATSASLTVYYDVDYNPTIDRAEQTEQSDLEFLMNLCNDYGLALKVSDGQLIVFDEADYEAVDPMITIVKPGTDYESDEEDTSDSSTDSTEDSSSSDSSTESTDNSILETEMIYLTAVISYSFTSKLRDVYAACHVAYQQGKDKEVIEATFTAPNKTGKTLQVKEQVESTADALRLAKKRLREKNCEEVTGRMTLLGSFRLVAGVTIVVLGFGAYDGNYIITEASHSVGNGYTTDINIRKCLDGY